MRYYQFKTFRTSYFFPDTDRRSKFLYGLYHPYGSAAVKIYWRLFKSCRLLRILFSVDDRQLEQHFPYRKIMGMFPEGSRVSFNLGTPGEEQKISMLGYNPENGGSFFAKYSTKEKAKALSRNEIRVLREIDELHIAPRLLAVKEDDECVFFMTTRAEGKAYTSLELTDEVMDVLLMLGAVKTGRDKASGLRTSFSHGDFCPWNMLQDGDKIRLIDWEMAGERVLGYDLFLFLIHAGMMTGSGAPDILDRLRQNQERIQRYFDSFGIDDFRPYLRWFIGNRMEEEERKGRMGLVDTYREVMQEKII